MNGRMRKRLPAVLTGGALVLALALTGCPVPDDNGGNGIPPAPNVTSVTVGPQVGTVVAGNTGTLGFDVTVAGNAQAFPVTIPGPNATVALAGGGMPVGITTATPAVSVQAPGATERLNFNIAATAGEGPHYLILTVHGVSQPFTLTVASPPADDTNVTAVTVVPATEPGTAVSGTAGVLNFYVTVTGTGADTFPVLIGGTNAPFTLAAGGALPPGISPRTIQATTSGTPVTVVFDIYHTVAPATHSVILTVHGTPSQAFNITIDAPVADVTEVTVGPQVGQVTEGIGGTVSFQVTVTGNDAAFPVDIPGDYAVLTVVTPEGSSTTLPAGITATTVQATTSGTPVQLSFTVADTAEAAVHNLTLTVHGRASDPFTLTVAADYGYYDPGVGVTSVTVGPQVGQVTEGIGGTVSFQVTVTGGEDAFPVDIPGPSATIEITGSDDPDLPAGITATTVTAMTSNVPVTLSFTVAGIADAAVHSLTLTVRGTASQPFYLTIDEDDSDYTFAEAIDALLAGPVPSQPVTLHTANALEGIGPRTLYFDGYPVTVTVAAGTPGDVLLLNTEGSIFTVGEGVTLILDGVTLQGRGVDPDDWDDLNLEAMVRVNSGGTFEMLAGSKITRNNQFGRVAVGGVLGGAVHVSSGATFVMRDGEISGNQSVAGGGVFNAGTFTMYGGRIDDNRARPDIIGGTGGGVHNTGTFTMRGGYISDNEATESGGGVFTAGTFAMHGGTIADNEAGHDWAMEGGGGVFVAEDGTFTMFAGTISGNTAAMIGGGVNATGTFNMRGGSIRGNSAVAGGGVGVSMDMSDPDATPGTFRMSGGTIYGQDEPAHTNTAGDAGAALLNFGTAQWGTFDSGDNFTYAGTWEPESWEDNTIEVVNGNLVRPTP